jgi:hypothetical protein
VLQHAESCGNVPAVKLACAAAASLLLASCGSAVVAPATSETARTPTVAEAPTSIPAPAVSVAPQPDVELRDPHVAIVHGQSVPFDGIAEGLVWPALEKALGARRSGDVVTLQVARNVPVEDLLRAAWTARLADLHVQSADATGTLHAVELGARRDGAPSAPGCHLAVFLRPDGSLRIAAPGGPREIAADRAARTLARSLAYERARCPIKYVAFGAESDAAAWGPVFDVMLAVDAEKSAGDARYVLAQAMHPAAVTPR